MSSIRIKRPPKSLHKKKYPKFKSWLIKFFKINTCAYCWQSSTQVEIDHYIPKAYVSRLANSYSNLLISCKNCNSSSCKHDYHPKYKTRIKFKNDKHGFLIHNITREDILDIFILKNNGELAPRKKSGNKHKRALWLISVFGLNYTPLIDGRREILRKKALIKKFAASKLNKQSPHYNLLITKVKEAKNSLPYYETFLTIFNL